MSKSSFTWLALLLAISVCIVLPGRGQNRGQNQDQVQLPEGNGKATVQAACGVCHSMNQVTNSGHDREEWTTVLHMMVNVGAPIGIAPGDQKAISDEIQSMKEGEKKGEKKRTRRRKR